MIQGMARRVKPKKPIGASPLDLAVQSTGAREETDRL
jgi:hypothetical protein